MPPGPRRPILTVADLSVTFSTTRGPVRAVDHVSFHLSPGDKLAIVGESGSGKSQTAMALMGLLPRNGQASGQALFTEQNGHVHSLLALSAADLDRIRGRHMTMIFQEPMTSLDPLYRIGHQMVLPLQHHAKLSRTSARRRAIEWLDTVGIEDPHRRIDAYPHELSGGQRQRVMIAMALSTEPRILLADEPTTALDVTVAQRILALISDLQQRLQFATILISHDLNLVRRFADRVAVMANGQIVEQAPTRDLFETPRAPETRRLLAAEPRGQKVPPPTDAPVLLSAKNLTVDYPSRRRYFTAQTPDFRALDDVTLDVRQGETLGIVGESGSGKSTLGRALLKLHPATGLIRFEDRALESLSPHDIRPLRRQFQIVFQDPYGSLSPRMTAGDVVAEGLKVHKPWLTPAERAAEVVAMMTQVGIDPDTRTRFPHEFSGGQRQRLAIARAMILKPKLVVLDEPTSALDRTVQQDVIELLRRLQSDHKLAYVFISHDLAVVRALADRILVLRGGRIVEHGATHDVITNPKTTYTRELMQAAFGAANRTDPLPRAQAQPGDR